MNRDHARQRQRGQRQRLHARQRLGPHQKLASVEAVDPDAGKRRQHKCGNLSRESDQSQQQRRPRQPVDQPTGGDPRHPGANQRDALPGKEQPEVAVTQRAPRVRIAVEELVL